jgi:Tfp pilus assembly protein PilF
VNFQLPFVTWVRQSKQIPALDVFSPQRTIMPKSPLAAAVGALIAVTMATTFPGSAQEEKAEGFGTVHFPTSCNEAAQRRFDRAMRYQHSFWYRQSKEIFEGALQADPTCALAYWGIALSLLWNPHAAPPPGNMPLGLAALQKGKAIGAKTARERDYIDALMVLYADYENVPHSRRVQAYLKAMEGLAARYSDDDEAQILYGIALNVAASPTDKTYANQLKGAALLEPIFARQPRHPGVAHYLVHLYDTPELAEKGIGAAKRYAAVAPAAPHAQHMPSHIFTRVGYWHDSIASNMAAARAAKAGKEFHDQLHAMDYMVYAHLQLGQDRAASNIITEMVQTANAFNPEGGAQVAPYALSASPARYMVERGDWKGAAQLRVRPSKFLHTEAMTHFARALGAAQTGDLDAARADIAKLAALRDKLRAAKDAYWSEQVNIQWQQASAWLLFAEGKHDAALAIMGAAADAEDKTDKATVTPGQLAPARELYGAMLLARGMVREALTAFAATLQKEPRRLAATIGAARASQRLGDKRKAREYYAAAVTLGEHSEPVRSEIVEARIHGK